MEKTLKACLEIPFTSEREAQIAYEVLRVDKEPPRSIVTKSLSFENRILCVCFKASDPHQLKISINSFIDNLNLLQETIAHFGPPSSLVYSF